MTLLNKLHFIRGITTSIERHFLGPKNKMSSLYISTYLCLSDEEYTREQLQHVLREVPTATTMIVLTHDEADAQIFHAVVDTIIVLKPRVVDDIIPMLKKAVAVIPRPFMIGVMGVSRLPQRTPVQTNYERLWFYLKRLQRTESFSMVVVDHETTMGKKNSALLRRLFLEHTITKG